jgi:hypothetical protein
VLALGIKYGTHGDGAAVSVAVDGRLLLNVPLADLFRTTQPAVRRALAREQRAVAAAAASNSSSATAAAPPPLTGAHALSAADAQELSGHLALQVCGRAVPLLHCCL